MEYKYLIVTSIPVFCYNNQFYIDDTWAKDINGQLSLWKSLSIICPIKQLKTKQANLKKVNKKISFVTFDKFNEFLALMFKLSKKEGIIFEFAGTSKYGILGFIISKFFNRNTPNFITFDGPLSLSLTNNNSHFSFKRILVVIYVKIMRTIRKFAASTATGLISVGDGIIDEFDPERKYEDNYLIIPLTLFDNDELFYKEFSQNKKIKIACIDKLSPFKGVFELLKAFKLVSCELNNVELHIFGKGPQEGLLKDFVKKERIGSKVTFHGFVNHDTIMEKLKKIDILVNLTKVGDINRTMWEGAANGCAIIASDTKGVRSFFTNEMNALLVNPNDMDTIVKALRILCENPKIRREISKNALKLAEQFTNQKVKLMRKNWILNKI